VYERAVANVPPAPAKRYWQRYIYLWLNYALWEELEAGDAGRAREVYRACLKVIPHGAFTFAKARAPAPVRAACCCSRCAGAWGARPATAAWPEYGQCRSYACVSACAGRPRCAAEPPGTQAKCHQTFGKPL